MRAERPTLIYDGECGFCRKCVDLVLRRDREHRLEVVPFQDERRVAGFARQRRCLVRGYAVH